MWLHWLAFGIYIAAIAGMTWLALVWCVRQENRPWNP